MLLFLNFIFNHFEIFYATTVSLYFIKKYQIKRHQYLSIKEIIKTIYLKIIIKTIR